MNKSQPMNKPSQAKQNVLFSLESDNLLSDTYSLYIVKIKRQIYVETLDPSSKNSIFFSNFFNRIPEFACDLWTQIK